MAKPKTKKTKMDIPAQFLRRGRSRRGEPEDEEELPLAPTPPPPPPPEDEDLMMPTLMREMEPELQAPRIDEDESEEEEEPGVLPVLKKVTPPKEKSKPRLGRPRKPKVEKKKVKRKKDGTIIDKEVPSTSSSADKDQNAGTLPPATAKGTESETLRKPKREPKAKKMKTQDGAIIDKEVRPRTRSSGRGQIATTLPAVTAKPKRERRPRQPQAKAKKVRTQDANGTVIDSEVPSTSRSVQLQGQGAGAAAPPATTTPAVKEKEKVVLLERQPSPLRKIQEWTCTGSGLTADLAAPDLDEEELRAKFWFQLRRRSGKIFYIDLTLGKGEDAAPKSALVKVCLYVKKPPAGEMLRLVMATIGVVSNEDSTVSTEFRIVEPSFAKTSFLTKEVLEKATQDALGTVFVQ